MGQSSSLKSGSDPHVEQSHSKTYEKNSTRSKLRNKFKSKTTQATTKDSFRRHSVYNLFSSSNGDRDKRERAKSDTRINNIASSTASLNCLSRDKYLNKSPSPSAR